MSITGIPPAEVAIDATLVRALLEAQHPDLAMLPLTAACSGWDNVLFRLGDRLAVRLPRRSAAAALIEHEQRWLPMLAARLPLPVPAPVRIGNPGCGYPWSWSVTPWLPGEAAVFDQPLEFDAVANHLGSFLRALHGPAPAGAPPNPFRGVPLADRDDGVRERMRRLEGIVDRDAVLAAWSAAIDAPPWVGPPLWIHGDFHPANLLVEGSRVSAVIDFGDLTAGDPATDFAIAWMLLPAGARSRFRAGARAAHEPVDDPTWNRARGWALAIALAMLESSRDSAPIRALALRTIRAVLDDPPL